MTEDRCIDVDRVRVHYLAAGNGGAPVILIHGGSLDSASLSWGPCSQSLSQSHVVFAPDLPGYGQSEKPDVLYTVSYFTRFLHRFACCLDLGSFQIIGFSMGGQIALSFALAFPDRVPRLVLVSSAGLGTRLHWPILAKLMIKLPGLHQIVRRVATCSRQSLKMSVRSLISNRDAISETLLEELVQAARVPGAGRAWRSYLEHEISWSGFRHNFLERLAEIRCPTLIVHGARDRLVPVKWARRAHELIPDSYLQVFENCGHWPQREEPQEFTRTALRFLHQ